MCAWAFLGEEGGGEVAQALGPACDGDSDRGLTCGCCMALLTCLGLLGGTGTWRMLLSAVVCAVMLQCIPHPCSTQVCCSGSKKTARHQL